MRLLQLPVTELEQAIKEEIEKNPLLDAEVPDTEDIDTLVADENSHSDWDSDEDDDVFGSYNYREHEERDPNVQRREYVVADALSFSNRLSSQLINLSLNERQRLIADEIIGSLDDAGYLARDLALIANDMAFRHNIEVTESEALEVLHLIQRLDPPGIGARNLQECLLLQLQRKQIDNSGSDVDIATLQLATTIVSDHFDDFANHRYDRLASLLSIDNATLAEATALIRRLNPKPGSSESESTMAATPVIPDIILQNDDGALRFFINDGHLPRLSLNSYYTDMLADLEKRHGDRETISFLRSKQGDAQSFIDLLQQRHNTIARVMSYIIKHQRRYLLTGNPDLLQPLRQREVAEATGLDISTISRMANSKYLQTPFGTIPLKDCFSLGLANEAGEEVSVESAKQRLMAAIEGEDKHKPLSDDALTRLLQSQGLPIARRTVAKYRELLGIPVARLRRIVGIVLLLATSSFGSLSAQSSYYDSVIAARLERSRRLEQREERRQQAQAEVSRRQVAKQQEARRTQAASQQGGAEESARSVLSPLAPELAPLWYDAFPSHRVNPYGRTHIESLPDEINLQLVHDSGEFCFPVLGPKTSNYGWRWQRGHHGVDISLRTGDPVHAAFGGTVRVASRMGGYGNCIVLRHPNGLETLYGHLSKINVRTNQHVEAGEVIGLGGNTGNSTGPHLHFECRFLYLSFDPEWILDFTTHTLRTRRLHLDKSYFGIRKPRRGETLDYKADHSIIKESKRGVRGVPTTTPINSHDF